LFVRADRRFSSSSHRLKPPPLHPTLLLLEFARRPAPQAEAARTNYNSNVLCSKSLSSAGMIRPGNQCFTLSRVESSGMTCTAGTTLVFRKQYNKLTAFVARVCTAQWRQPVLAVRVWGTPFSGCRGCLMLYLSQYPAWCLRVAANKAFQSTKYKHDEHSEQARAPHINGPRDVPRFGALSLLQKTLH
jgi:hypothetical protein